MRNLIEKFLKDIGVDTDVNKDTYRGTLKEMLISDLEEYQEDVAFVAGLLQKNDENVCLNDLDEYYEIATQFVERYPPGINWEGKDFEEEVVKFRDSLCGNS